MKKPLIIIVAALVLAIGIGAVIFLKSAKECAELNEQECKKDDSCLSVLVPCQDPSCASNAIFKECKDKAE
jgi:hypothetical protein